MRLIFILHEKRGISLLLIFYETSLVLLIQLLVVREPCFSNRFEGRKLSRCVARVSCVLFAT